MSWTTSGKTVYRIEVINEDHPMYGDFAYDVRKMAGSVYYGDGRFCRDLDDVMRYLSAEERKREKTDLQINKPDV